MSVVVARSAGPLGSRVVGYKMTWLKMVDPSQMALA